MIFTGFLLKNFCFKDGSTTRAENWQNCFYLFLSIEMTHNIDILWHLIYVCYVIYSFCHRKTFVPNKSVAVSSKKSVPEDHRPSLAVVLSSAFEWEKWDLVSCPQRDSQISFTEPFPYLLGADQYVFIMIYASPRHNLQLKRIEILPDVKTGYGIPVFHSFLQSFLLQGVQKSKQEQTEPLCLFTANFAFWCTTCFSDFCALWLWKLK